MAVESWQASAFVFGTAVCTTSAELQTAIAAKLVAAGWTDLGGGVYKGPSATRWIQVTFTQPSGTTLEIALVDYLARAATSRRVGAVANPSTWNIHANPFGFFVWDSTGNGWAMAGVLDHFPKAATSHNLDVYFGAYHTTADATLETADHFQTAIYTGVISSSIGRIHRGGPMGYTPDKQTSGVRRDLPMLVWTDTDASYRRYAGMMHHAIIITGTIAKDSLILVAIDADENVNYKVTGILGTHGTPVRKVAVRTDL